MIEIIGGLLAGLWPKIIAGLVAIAGVVGFVWKNRRDAVRLDRAEQREKDHERAEDIRDRVERDLPDKLHDYDDAGFRD